MDSARFDSLTRRLAGRGISRRGLLAGAAAALLGGRGALAQASCPPGQTANRRGECSCPAGTDPCPAGCFDLKRDAANCGSCGLTCLPGEVCQKGACRCPAGTVCGCPAGQTFCPELGGCAECCDASTCPLPTGPCQVATCDGGVCGAAPRCPRYGVWRWPDLLRRGLRLQRDANDVRDVRHDLSGRDQR